jgi:hypothetical protein
MSVVQDFRLDNLEIFEYRMKERKGGLLMEQMGEQ